MAALEEVPQRLTEDSIPPLQRVQLLRSFPQLSQEAGNVDLGAACLVLHAMRAADGQRHLAGMLGARGDRRQQQGAAGDRLAVMFRVGQTDE